MILGTDLDRFDVHNDGYFHHLPLRHVNGVILEMSVARMTNESVGEGFNRVSNDKKLDYMFDVGESFGRLDLYLDHLDTELSEYLGQADTTEKDACVFIGNLTQLEYLY
ncbi:hypothetical protein Tco_0297864, partial [Tanacetum coccineum]